MPRLKIQFCLTPSADLYLPHANHSLSPEKYFTFPLLYFLFVCQMGSGIAYAVNNISRIIK